MVSARLRFGASCTGLALVAGAALLAQGALAQLGVRETDAREWLQKTVEDGGPSGSVSWDDRQVQQVLATFKKLPANAKGPLTTQLYAWAKGVLTTPAFRARYDKTRAERKPVVHTHPGTVDDELKTRIAKETADMETTWKQMESSGMKELQDLAAQQRKDWPKQREQFVAGWRADIEDTRRRDKEDDDTGMRIWTDLYPPDPMTVVAKSLRAFVDATPDVDFAAKQEIVQGEGGAALLFVNKAYWEKPWQWKFAYEWGPEAIAAARTAAQAWLKELGK
jgi:hypothetical protein